MQFIWNVSEHVGDTTSCPNRPTDVNLVKILIHATLSWRRPPWINSALRMGFRTDGRMDPITAYWIRFFNADHSRRLHQKRDGIISPARGAHFAPNDTWTIVKLNWASKQANATRWANLPSDPSCTAPLRNELT
jgi:hypothetical protein